MFVAIVTPPTGQASRTISDSLLTYRLELGNIGLLAESKISNVSPWSVGFVTDGVGVCP